ncbi:MAG: hypothetical protein ACXWNZ_12310 [Vulcanimicrobiaceae bacterium]
MLLGPPKSAGAASDRTERWVGRAASPVDAAKDGFHDQTIRMVVHVSIGGSAVRIRLSNGFGEAPLTIGHVTVGLARSTTTSFAVAHYHRAASRGNQRRRGPACCTRSESARKCGRPRQGSASDVACQRDNDNGGNRFRFDGGGFGVNALARMDRDNAHRIRPAYDSDDHLHPNDDGYRAMGNAVPLELFVRLLSSNERRR